MDYGSVNGYLHFKQPQDVVDRVQARHGRDAHEVGHVHEGLGAERAEFGILRKQVSVFEQLRGQKLLLLELESETLDLLFSVIVKLV